MYIGILGAINKALEKASKDAEKKYMSSLRDTQRAYMDGSRSSKSDEGNARDEEYFEWYNDMQQDQFDEMRENRKYLNREFSGSMASEFDTDEESWLLAPEDEELEEDSQKSGQVGVGYRAKPGTGKRDLGKTDTFQKTLNEIAKYLREIRNQLKT